jgi:ATP-dependent DNA helicase RecQ
LIQEGTIVVSPLIALMKNQVDAIRSLSSERAAHVLNSSLTKTEIAQVKRHLFGLTKLFMF